MEIKKYIKNGSLIFSKKLILRIKVLMNDFISERKALTSDIILEIWQLIGLLEKGGCAASAGWQEIIIAKYQSRRPMGHHRPVVIGNCGTSPKGLVLSPRVRELSLRNETRSRMRSKVPAMWHWTLEEISRSRRKSYISPPTNCYDPGTIGLVSSHVESREIGVCESLHLARHQARGKTQDDCSEKPMTQPRYTHRFTEGLEITARNQVLIKL